ncbi:MAG: hypothetical protein IPP94_18635 [Ignavibacteria bacterium]|nr:hypothetical protein [Ignavibacteria bacterium]
MALLMVHDAAQQLVEVAHLDVLLRDVDEGQLIVEEAADERDAQHLVGGRREVQPPGEEVGVEALGHVDEEGRLRP